MSFLTFVFLSAALLMPNAGALSIDGNATIVAVLHDQIMCWDPNINDVPDGKFVSFPESLDACGSTNFIINLSPDFRLRSASSALEDVIAPAPGNPSNYPATLPAIQGTNTVVLPLNLPIPDPSITGFRDAGDQYDEVSVWANNMFRLSETSQPDADPDAMLAIVHNEDHYEDTTTPGDSLCVFKSIGVKYSSDLGRSWTRSLPILSLGTQPTNLTCSCCPGTGDMSSAWNPFTQQWTVIAPDVAGTGFLTMSVSSDPLARPETWTRVDPVTGATSPGLQGKPVPHGDLMSAPGSAVTIMRDDLNQVWQMVYSQYIGGLVITNSSDLQRWYPPVKFYPSDPSVSVYYPSLIGNRGDALATDGKATLYYGGNDPETPDERQMWALPLTF